MKKQNETSYWLDEWNSKELAIAHFLIFALIITWNIPFTKQAWIFLDKTFFLAFQGILQQSPFLSSLFAIMNHRSFDILIACFMFYPIYHYLWKEQDQDSHSCEIIGSYFIFTGLFLFLSHQGLKLFIETQRLSPSLAFETTFRLSEIFPHLHIKDSSVNSFPGDHTAVLLVWMALFFRLNRWKLYTVLLTVFASLPRLASGAHWLTDDLLGSVVLATIAYSWAVYSPSSYIFSRLFRPLFAFLDARLLPRSS